MDVAVGLNRRREGAGNAKHIDHEAATINRDGQGIEFEINSY
jgi:hypothetical protein